jgi:hypothetical protein
LYEANSLTGGLFRIGLKWKAAPPLKKCACGICGPTALKIAFKKTRICGLTAHLSSIDAVNPKCLSANSRHSAFTEPPIANAAILLDFPKLRLGRWHPRKSKAATLALLSIAGLLHS